MGLEPEVLFTTYELLCFEFGGSYLMVERDEREQALGQVNEGGVRLKSGLWLNVEHVRSVCRQLDRHKIDYQYRQQHSGTVVKFQDPDSNLCTSKDAATFNGQIEDFNELG